MRWCDALRVGAAGLCLPRPHARWQYIALMLHGDIVRTDRNEPFWHRGSGSVGSQQTRRGHHRRRASGIRLHDVKAFWWKPTRGR